MDEDPLPININLKSKPNSFWCF